MDILRMSLSGNICRKHKRNLSGKNSKLTNLSLVLCFKIR